MHEEGMLLENVKSQALTKQLSLINKGTIGAKQKSYIEMARSHPAIQL